MSRSSKLRRTARRFTAKAETILQRLAPLDRAKLASDPAMKAFTLQSIAQRCRAELEARAKNSRPQEAR